MGLLTQENPFPFCQFYGHKQENLKSLDNLEDTL